MGSPVQDSSRPRPSLLIPNEAKPTLDVASIEVESTFDDETQQMIHRIVCVTPDEMDEYDDETIEIIIDEDSFLELQQNQQPVSMMETLAHQFMEGCGCAQFYPKSALRKTSRIGSNDDMHVAVGSDRVVSFSRLEIREFDVTLGEHPCATTGPPIALDWSKIAAERIVDVDDYERHRTPRRKRKQLKLRYKDRMGMLLQSDFTEDEVNRAWAEALQIRMQRKETLNRGLLLMIADDMYESACRKCRRFTDSVSSTLFPTTAVM